MTSSNNEEKIEIFFCIYSTICVYLHIYKAMIFMADRDFLLHFRFNLWIAKLITLSIIDNNKKEWFENCLH